MTRKYKSTKYRRLYITMPEDVYAKLEKMAEKEFRSKSNMIVKLIMEGGK